jgi:hypothetical protein
MRNLGRVRRGRSWSIDFSAANATFAHVPLAVLVKDTIRRETNADGDEHEEESNDRFKVHGSGTKQDEDEENVLALHFVRLKGGGRSPGAVFPERKCSCSGLLDKHETIQRNGTAMK